MNLVVRWHLDDDQCESFTLHSAVDEQIDQALLTGTVFICVVTTVDGYIEFQGFQIRLVVL